MDRIPLGKSNLLVSPLCLGCMSYGDPLSGHHAWVLDEEQSRPHIRRALEAGINFFDTANAYSFGASERVVGRALRDFARRDEVVIATKIFFPSKKDRPETGGLSRAAILREVDGCLERLGIGQIDLLQIHRWDYTVPIEETLAALHEVVQAGKVRYLGASSMYAWQFAKALYLADHHLWTRFISMQPHYNLLYREEEREMLPLCRAEGIAVLPWSPLARGRLARPWKSDPTAREQTDKITVQLYQSTEEADRRVVDGVEAVAKARQVSMSHVALVWLRQKPGITVPIFGATKPSHLDDALGSLALTLTEEEMKQLEEPYLPHAVAGHV